MSDTPFTIEVNHRFDPLDRAWQSHIFIKLYTAALDTGFLTAISDRDWKTLASLRCTWMKRVVAFPRFRPSPERSG